MIAAMIIMTVSATAKYVIVAIFFLCSLFLSNSICMSFTFSLTCFIFKLSRTVFSSVKIWLTFSWNPLRDGWYKVTELAPAAGYTIKQPATQEFYIKGGESKVITYENVPKNAIICEKYDSVTGAALPGCTFQLRYLGGTSGTGGTVIGTKVTGKNGTAMWTGLAPGAGRDGESPVSVRCRMHFHIRSRTDSRL